MKAKVLWDERRFLDLLDEMRCDSLRVVESGNAPRRTIVNGETFYAVGDVVAWVQSRRWVSFMRDAGVAA